MEKDKNVVTISSSVKWRGSKDFVTAKPKRYYIDSDGDHKYFVEVGNEGEFERWLTTFESNEAHEIYYEQCGYDYEKNRIDGHFTFTDPRCGQ